MSVNYLALLLAKAKNLEILQIHKQAAGQRRVGLKIVTDTGLEEGIIEEGYGNIVILDTYTGS